MAKFSDYKANKARDIIKASNARPEKPRIAEQTALEKNLLEAKNYYPEKERKINDEMLDELSTKWKGNEGGSGGDALISGLKSGFKQGSFIEDKKRHKQVVDFTQKMRDMVADQNIKLFQEEKEFNAIQKITPRVMAYMESYKNMSPNDRKVYGQNTIEEFNQAAGTNYKFIDTNGSEPWKMMVSDDGYPAQLDFMELIKTPEQKKTEYYYNSNQMKDYESELQNEGKLQNELLESRAASYRQKSESADPAKVQEKKMQLLESGAIPEGVMLFDELDKQEKKFHMDRLKVESDKGKAAKSGIKALDEMERIFERHPKISTSLAAWAREKEGHEGLFNKLLQNAVNQDERDALTQLEKHAARLAIGTIEQFKGQRPTDILKKLIRDSNPNGKFTYKAFMPISNQYKSEFNEQVLMSDEADNGIYNRYVPHYKNVKGKSQNVAEVPAGASNSPADAKNLSNLREKILKDNEALERKRQEILNKRAASGK